MKTSIWAIVALFLTGCTTLSEQQLERREYRNADWENKFVDYRTRCNRIAGRVLIDARGGTLDRDGVPDRGDYYTCSKRLSRN